jgi:hypothetical protein
LLSTNFIGGIISIEAHLQRKNVRVIERKVIWCIICANTGMLLKSITKLAMTVRDVLYLTVVGVIALSEADSELKLAGTVTALLELLHGVVYGF